MASMFWSRLGFVSSVTTRAIEFDAELCGAIVSGARTAGGCDLGGPICFYFVELAFRSSTLGYVGPGLVIAGDLCGGAAIGNRYFTGPSLFSFFHADGAHGFCLRCGKRPRGMFQYYSSDESQHHESDEVLLHNLRPFRKNPRVFRWFL